MKHGEDWEMRGAPLFPLELLFGRGKKEKRGRRDS